MILRVAVFLIIFGGCLREQVPQYVEVVGPVTVVADWGVPLDGKLASVTTLYPAASPLYAERIPDGQHYWRNSRRIYVQHNQPPRNVAFGAMGPSSGGPVLHVSEAGFYDFSLNETAADDLYERGEIHVATRSAWSTDVNARPWMPEIAFNAALAASGTAVSIDMADGASRPVSALPAEQESYLRHYACRSHAWAEAGQPWECFPFEDVWKSRDWFRCYRYTESGDNAVDEEVHCPNDYYPYFAIEFDDPNGRNAVEGAVMDRIPELPGE